MVAQSDESAAPSPAPSPADAVLVFAPGIGHHPVNTAETVADVVARILSRQRRSDYPTDPKTPGAPRGLRTGKTIVAPDGARVLDVFELDYRHRLEDLDPDADGAVPPSLRVALRDSVVTLAWTRRALGKPQKTLRAKVQLFLGFLASLAVVGAGVIAGVSALAAFDTAGWANALALGGNRAETGTAVVTGGVTLTAWTKGRRAMLSGRAQLHQVLRYLTEDGHRRTVTLTVEDAIDGLLDMGYEGRPIHVVGYSLGSLVVFDAIFPPAPPRAGHDRNGPAVRSLTTIGLPIDTLGLYYPEHLRRRAPRSPNLVWRNVFIPADVLGSNLRDDDDYAGGEVTPEWTGASVTCVRHTEETLNYVNLLTAKGFRLHGGYWSTPDGASCFEDLVDLWVPRRGDEAGPVPEPMPDPTA